MRMLMVLVALVVAPLGAVSVSAQETAERPVVAAMFYSSFCATCRIVEPRVDAVRDEYEERPVTFIRFNTTWSALGGADRRADLAAEHGMAELWERYKSRQGFMMVVDPATQELLNVVTMRHSEDDIRAILEAALTPPTPDA